MAKMNGAQLLVACLEAQGVEYIFGIPGAKIDAVFNALLDSKIRLIVCRHEQNAAFIAAAYGRLTGKPGVVLVTSGPGVGNLVTGLLTATTEGDPLVAIGGNVAQSMGLRHAHQGTNNVKLMEAVTKQSVEVHHVDTIAEIVVNAFRVALEPTCGATFISFPQDIGSEITSIRPITQTQLPVYGRAAPAVLQQAITLINQARSPVLLLGMEASRPENTAAIHELLKRTPMAVVGTYQAAGAISTDYLDCFIGRVGLFKNQPGDQMLDLADVVITVGYNSVEYDSETWNADNKKTVIHIDYTPCQVHQTYHPVCELLGDIAANICALSQEITPRPPDFSKKIMRLRQELMDKIASGKNFDSSPIHPLRFIYELKQVVDSETTICCDIGTVYMWIARYFLSYHPHQLLFSNGQQTLGVALPWAIATHYARPRHKIISISGDGGFLFSAMELETAVREHIHLIHFIWRDGTYNMVLEQEVMKYKRKSGVDFGRIHVPSFAEGFGALGLELTHPDQFQTVFQQAVAAKKPVLVDVAIDYSHNKELFKVIDPNHGH